MRRSITMGLLGAFFAGMLAATLMLYVSAHRPLHRQGEEALVRRATKAAATHFGTTEAEIGRMTFPVAMRLSEQT